ncbi:MAG: efflux RND transporter permease subunit [Oscillospiraceae bacterium]|nr:efflux RND transporter permease subunit [Oscillospiraceae bacterium]
MTKLSVRRPVATLMILLVFLAFGGMSLFNLRMDLFPNMNIPVAAVITTYSGAAPDQVQRLVTEPIERGVATLQGLDTLSSTSDEGFSFVVMQFSNDVDIDMAAIDIREAIDMIRMALPDGAGDPMVIKADMNMGMDAIIISIASDTHDLVTMQYIVEDRIRDRLARQSGVATVNLSGGREREVAIELMTDRMRGFGVSEAQVMGLLATENTSRPVGTLDEAGRNLAVVVDAQFSNLDDIRNLPIVTPMGGQIFLRDIAEVREVYSELSSFSYLNGEPALTLSIQPQSDANTVNVSRAVRSELDRIIAEFPELDIGVILDPADFIMGSINAVSNTALFGMFLAIIVLFFFLRDIRATLVLAAAIPLSIIVTFSFMFFAGMSLNMMSLGGLTLGVGLLIDNSIVVLEAIFRRMSVGEDRVRAAINGTKEVMMSIVASTITTMSVFVPVAWLGGLIAQIFTDLALSVSFSLGASLLVAITFVPMACSLFLVPKELRTKKRRWAFTEKLGDAVEGVGKKIDFIGPVYARAIAFATRRRVLVMIIAFVFFMGSMVSVAVIGTELMPAADQSQINIGVRLPTGAVLERTDDVTMQVLDRLEGVPEISNVSTTVGGGGFFGGTTSHSASVTVALVPLAERERSSTEIANEIRGFMHDIAGAEITVEALTSMMVMGGMGGGDVHYNILGDDILTLVEVSEDLVELLGQVEGLRDVTSSIGETMPRAVVNVDRMRASSFGLTAQGIMSAANNAIQGSQATVMRVAGNELAVRVNSGDAAVNDLTGLETLLIPTPAGTSIPLREVATIEITQSPMSISRHNQQTVMTISGSLDGRDLGSVVSDINYLIATQYIFPMGVSLEPTGDQEFMDQELQSLMLAMLVAVFVVYAIMAAEFESLFYPFIIMFAVPVALSTGIFGLLVMGQSLGITAALGLIVLVAIVLNNGIVLIDYINLLRGKGMPLIDAVREAGVVRLRAILMTTLTTALGLLPMMLGRGEGAEVMAPLAVVVVFGLVFSTFVTLLVIPAIYITFENIRTKLFGERTKFREIEEI